MTNIICVTFVLEVSMVKVPSVIPALMSFHDFNQNRRSISSKFKVIRVLAVVIRNPGVEILSSEFYLFVKLPISYSTFKFFASLLHIFYYDIFLVEVGRVAVRRSIHFDWFDISESFDPRHIFLCPFLSSREDPSPIASTYNFGISF
jgi:hypothetical protein